MTLSVRNWYFKAMMGGAFLFLIIFAAALALSFSACPQAVAAAARRVPAAFIRFSPPQGYGPLLAQGGAVLYACTALLCIYYFFEKTQAPEILFFALFAGSFSAEAARIVPALSLVYQNLPGLYLVLASRVLLFGRYFGLFSLFAASVYAAGLGEQKQGNVIGIIAVAALVVTLGAPVDAQAWDSSLAMLHGLREMFRLASFCTTLITLAGFFVAAYVRDSREYLFAAAGAALVCAGRPLLLSADTLLSPVLALLFLSAGTWLICSRLHRAYLWL